MEGRSLTSIDKILGQGQWALMYFFDLTIPKVGCKQPDLWISSCYRWIVVTCRCSDSSLEASPGSKVNWTKEQHWQRQ